MFDIREYLHPVGSQVPQAKCRYKVGIEPESLFSPFHSYYFFFYPYDFLSPQGATVGSLYINIVAANDN